jgi:uncharacterized protein (DUF1499 family)
MVSPYLRWLLVVALAGGAGWALTAWPRLNEVETGRTPEYPDLQVRTYSAGPRQVSEAAREALSRRPRWTVVGSGEGPAGSVVSAVHTTPLLRFKDDVTVSITRKGGETLVSVHSRSRVGAWDFGQNARNIRELLAALDAELR